MSRIIAATVLAASLATSVSAHARVWTWSVDGVDANTGSGIAPFIRTPPNNNPVKDLTSTDVRCNVGGTTAVSAKFSAKAGSKLTPEWFHDNRGDDIIASSHVGPIVTYLAPAASNGEGDVWVKIAESGYANGKWAVDNLIANRGKHDITLPASLSPGEYLIRDEILALHESDTLYTANKDRGMQLYPSCAQLTVTAGGSAKLPAGVAIPGVYKDSTPGIEFSVYGGSDPKSYVIPGPAVWNGAGAAVPAPVTPTTTAVAVKSSTIAVAAPSSKIPVTSVVKPVTSAAPAPVVTSSTKAAPANTTSKVAPVLISSSKPAPIVSSSKAAAGTATTAAAPASKATDQNDCFRVYNKCLDAGQPHPDWAGCTAARDTCIAGLGRKRMHKVAANHRA